MRGLWPRLISIGNYFRSVDFLNSTATDQTHQWQPVCVRIIQQILADIAFRIVRTLHSRKWPETSHNSKERGDVGMFERHPDIDLTEQPLFDIGSDESQADKLAKTACLSDLYDFSFIVGDDS